MARRHLVVFLLATVIGAISLVAQSDNAAISGYVRDASGAVVPNASVTVRNEATGLERKTQSNSTGYYIVTSLPPGFYTVIVEMQGFRRSQKTQNKLDPNVPLTVDVDLQVGAVAETVEVVAAAATIQSETAAVGKLVEGRQISDLQLNGRNAINLALLKPGVRGGSLAGLSGLGPGGLGLSINGARDRETSVTYDGAVAMRTRANGAVIGYVDLDSVQEVQILTANYSAEYGRSSGGQIRLVTKGGSSKFHGSFYEFFRNNELDANTWVRNASPGNGFVPPLRFNQFGFNIGGPVPIKGVRNKLFFFYSEEWLRRRLAASRTGTVPSLAMRRGDFSQLLTTNPFFGGARIINDPTTGQPFQGNVIPTARQSRNGIALLSVYPAPNTQIGTTNWISAASQPTNQRKDSFNFDYLPASNHTVKIRLNNYNYLDFFPFQSNFDLFSRIFDRPNQTGSVNWIWTISPTWVNELLIAGSKDKVRIGITQGPGYDRTKFGIDFPFAFPGTKNIATKIPTVDIANFTSYSGSPYPSSSSGPIYNIADNITKVHGSHTLKFGVLWERAGQNDFDQINVQGVPGGSDNQNGRFVFTNTRTGGSGLAIANAALGLYDTYAEIGTRSYTPYRGFTWEWFVQDGWKVTPKLKVEMGLRHTIIRPYFSLWRNMAIFDPRYYDPSKAVAVNPNTGNPIAGAGDPYNGIVIPGSGFTDGAKGRVPIADSGTFNHLFRGEPKEYSNTHYKDFQPRVGVAYSLTPKMVARAGIGRFVSRTGVSDSTFLGGNPPLQPLASFANGIVDNPAGGAGSTFPLSVTTQDKIFRNPQSWNWNVTVEREVGFDTVVEIGYVGRRGLHSPREKDINQVPIGTCPSASGGCPFINGVSGARFNVNALRPFKGYGPIRVTNNEASSFYNGLQISTNRRFSKGLAFGVAYTFSKSSDDGSDLRDVIPINNNAHYLWGPSNFDTRHLMVINAIYELPFFRDKSTLRGKLLGGWQITAVTQFQTGTPVRIQTADDFAGVGGAGNNIQSLWIVNGNPKTVGKFSTSAADSNTYLQICSNGNSPLASCAAADRLFTAPTPANFTSQENRNRFYDPGFQNWNLGLFKTFAINESHAVAFRAEAFNWLNHPNWNGFSTNPTSATFGKVTAKSSERNLQLSLRYSF